MDYTESFLYLDGWWAAFLCNFTSVTHYYIAISNSVNLVYSNLFTKLIKLTEKSWKQANHVLWLCILRKLCKSDHVGVQHCDIFKWVNHFLVIFDSRQHMQGYEFAKKVFGLLNFNFNDTLLVILAANFHLTTVWSKNEQGKKHELQHTIDHVGL